MPTQVSRTTIILLGTPGFDFNIDRNRLADTGDRLSRLGKHQIEIASRDRPGRYLPPRPARLVERCD